MANTERLTTIQRVREAKKAAGSARFDTALSASKRKALEKLYLKLDDIEDLLILGEISNKVDALTQSSKELDEVNRDIKENIKELEGITEIVAKASDAIKVLVDLTVKAAALV